MELECLGCDKDILTVVCPHCGYDHSTGERPAVSINLQSEVGVYLNWEKDRPKLMEAARKAGVTFIDTNGRRHRFHLPDGDRSRHEFYKSLVDLRGWGWYYMQWHGNPLPPK